MLVAVYFFIINVVVPQLAAYANALVEPVMTIIITLAGILMILGAMGIRISNNLGSTILGGIFRVVGYLGRTLIQAIGWIVRNTFRIIPIVFNGSRRTFTQLGLNSLVSNLLALVVVVIVVVIII